MLHDLTIRTIAEYLIGENPTLFNLERLSHRFYGLRDIFISILDLETFRWTYGAYKGSVAETVYQIRPYGWNKVRRFIIGFQSEPVDLSLFSHIHTLTINCCDKITNVSALSNVKHLTIRFCQSLQDITPLAKVPKLTLVFCQSIRDVTALSGVRDLTIYNCNHITDLSCLGTVYRLNLSGLNLKDVTPFTQVKKLILKGCHCPTGYEGLEKMKNLIMLDCT